MSDDNIVAFPGDARRACPHDLLVPAVEACLFACPGVVTVGQLVTALGVPESHVRGALLAIEERLERTGSGIRLHSVSEGYQLRTDLRLAAWVAAIRGGKPWKLSQAANQALAIVAFRQPVTKGLLDELRGVDSGGVLKMLADRGLVRSDGRSDEPGRPLQWVTTPTFLELFGLRSLADLPTLKDLHTLGPDGGPDIAVADLQELARTLRPGPRPVDED